MVLGLSQRLRKSVICQFWMRPKGLCLWVVVLPVCAKPNSCARHFLPKIFCLCVPFTFLSLMLTRVNDFPAFSAFMTFALLFQLFSAFLLLMKCLNQLFAKKTGYFEYFHTFSTFQAFLLAQACSSLSKLEQVQKSLLQVYWCYWVPIEYKAFTKMLGKQATINQDGTILFQLFNLTIPSSTPDKLIVLCDGCKHLHLDCLTGWPSCVVRVTELLSPPRL